MNMAPSRQSVLKTKEDHDAAFHIVILGAAGGPREDNVTGLLVRSTAMRWEKNSMVTVDGGTLVGGIIRVLQQSEADVRMIESQEMDSNEDHRHDSTTSTRATSTVSSGPFAGLTLPHRTSEASAAYIFRHLISAFLITHPHLDHVAGLAMNTPLVEAELGPKTIAALPPTVAGIKHHIFNDITWPNLSDEDGGAGLITYQRLVDGGNPRLGRGDSRGYVRAADGLLMKCMSISHGQCHQRYNPNTGRHHRAESDAFCEHVPPSSRRPSEPNHTHPSHGLHALAPSNEPKNISATVESSAFFIRDIAAGAEILVFGDIEPDSISLAPRNAGVWAEAARKFVSGNLRAIFIECSFSDAVEDSSLYGHLAPRHLVTELEVLAAQVREVRRQKSQVHTREEQDQGQYLRPEQQRSQPPPAPATVVTPATPPLRKRKRNESREPVESPVSPKTGCERRGQPPSASPRKEARRESGDCSAAAGNNDPANSGSRQASDRRPSNGTASNNLRTSASPRSSSVTLRDRTPDTVTSRGPNCTDTPNAVGANGTLSPTVATVRSPVGHGDVAATASVTANAARVNVAVESPKPSALTPVKAEVKVGDNNNNNNNNHGACRGEARDYGNGFSDCGDADMDTEADINADADAMGDANDANDCDNRGEAETQTEADLTTAPLAGLAVFIIHVKESLADGASESEPGAPRARILAQVQERSARAGLGCEFVALRSGQGAYV